MEERFEEPVDSVPRLGAVDSFAIGLTGIEDIDIADWEAERFNREGDPILSEDEDADNVKESNVFPGYFSFSNRRDLTVVSSSNSSLPPPASKLSTVKRTVFG